MLQRWNSEPFCVGAFVRSLFIKLKFSVNEDGEITEDLAIYKQIVQAHIRNANAKFYLPTGLMSHSKFRPRLR